MSDSNEKLNDKVEDTESLARFLDQGSKFSNNRVKHHAFHPPKGTSTTSVFRSDNCSNKFLIEIGTNLKFEIKAIASLLVKDVRSIHSSILSVVSDAKGDQHPRHAHIVFPIKNDSNENFTKIKDICMEIAKCASLIKNSNGEILSKSISFE